MRARVLIRPKAGILDPQGIAVERALPGARVRGRRRTSTSGGWWSSTSMTPRSSTTCAGGCWPTRSSRTTRSWRASPPRTAREVRRHPLPGLLRRRRRAARGLAGGGGRAAVARRPRPAGRRRRRRPGRLLLWRLPARRRHRALRAGHGGRHRLRARAAARCSGSATASRSCARPACSPGALLPNDHLRFRCRQVEVEVLNAGTVFTRACEEGERLSIPCKHTTGRYWAPDEQLDALEAERAGRPALRAGREPERLGARHRRRVQRGRQRHGPHAPSRARGRRAAAAVGATA